MMLKDMSVDVRKAEIGLIMEYFTPWDIQEEFELIREVLKECETFHKWSVYRNSVILLLSKARIEISVHDRLTPANVRVLFIPHVINITTDPNSFGFEFWTEPVRLAKLKNKILASPEKKGDYLTLWGANDSAVDRDKHLRDSLRRMRKELLEKEAKKAKDLQDLLSKTMSTKSDFLYPTYRDVQLYKSDILKEEEAKDFERLRNSLVEREKTQAFKGHTSFELEYLSEQPTS